MSFGNTEMGLAYVSLSTMAPTGDYASMRIVVDAIGQPEWLLEVALDNASLTGENIAIIHQNNAITLQQAVRHKFPAPIIVNLVEVFTIYAETGAFP
ncbi:MAG: hypothetical protein OEM32_04530 [Acidimicrobiia bacterium]|nr:hypothetical protein [Acidimicrobiia bacterium]